MPPNRHYLWHRLRRRYMHLRPRHCYRVMRLRHREPDTDISDLWPRNSLPLSLCMCRHQCMQIGVYLTPPAPISRAWDGRRGEPGPDLGSTKAKHATDRGPCLAAVAPKSRAADPVPVLLLANLALHREEHGTGLGADLLRDALVRAVASSAPAQSSWTPSTIERSASTSTTVFCRSPASGASIGASETSNGP